MSGSPIAALAYADTRLLWRDPLLKWVALLPFGLALIFRVLLPRAQAALLASTGFDLSTMYPLIMGGYLMNAAGIVGMVVGFLLLDERDARTLSALRVTPLSMRHYLAYRVAVPLLVGTASTLIGYPIVGVATVPLASLLPIALVAAFSAPLVALILAAAAPNKVAGLAFVKVLNGINLLPVAAFFVAPPLQFAAGVIPTYWPMRALWSASAGESFAAYLVMGIVSAMAALGASASLFERRLLRRG
jgi:fluoroquinolone transport system permease protein